MTELVRILVADDHYVVRQGLASLLVPRNGFEVVGEATTGRQVVELARELQPDVIIMDMVMPEMSGPEAIALIRRDDPSARILVLTSFGEAEQVAAAIEAGASGYLLKEASPDDLLLAIANVRRGHLVLPQDLAQRLIQGKDASVPTGSLTAREVDVLGLLAQGLTNKQIAGRLHISATTVRSHVSSILAKLHAANRTQAVLVAQERGLL